MTDDLTSTRVLAAGQWLGTGNRISELRWTKARYGWVARDTTGEEYCQLRPMGEPVLASIFHSGPNGPVSWFFGGLMTVDSLEQARSIPRPWPVTPWPDPPEVV